MKTFYIYLCFVSLLASSFSLKADNLFIVAKINNDIITNEDLESRLDLALTLSNLPKEDKIKQQLRKQVLNILIDETIKIQEAQRLASRGVKELLVIAQDSTSYGWDASPKTSLHELFTELDKIDGIEWLRLHYAHPSNLHRKMIDQFKHLQKLIPYIDMPIQHGADKMLKIMRRGLKSDGIKKKIDSLRNSNNDIAIRTSIIVGHPGETDKEFNELLKFISEVEFDRLGVFQYSHEEDTLAGNVMKDEVPKKVKKERFEQTMELQQKINLRKNKSLVGTEQKILVDMSKDNFSLGRTYRDSPTVDNYVKINTNLETGKFYNVKIEKALEYDLLGQVVK